MSENISNQHNFYELLGVDHTVDDATLDDAFEARLQACEELGFADNSELTPEEIKQIRIQLITAYKTLRDPAQRASYDAQNGTTPNIDTLHTESEDPNLNSSFTANNETNESIFLNDTKIENNNPEHNESDETNSRTRRFTEFPSFPNMVATQQAVSNTTPRGRLKKTTSISAETVNELNQEIRRTSLDTELKKNNLSQEATPTSTFEAMTREVEANLDNLAKHFKNGTSSSSDPRRTSFIPEQVASNHSLHVGKKPKSSGTGTFSSSRSSIEMPRAYVNTLNQSKKRYLDFLLVFCAFVLPLASIIFAVTYYLANR